MDVDLGLSAVLDGLTNPRGPAMLNQLRLLFGWQPFERLAMYGGPTLSVLTNDVPAVTTGEVRVGSELDRPGYGWTVADRIESTTRIRVWPGFAVGLRF